MIRFISDPSQIQIINFKKGLDSTTDTITDTTYTTSYHNLKNKVIFPSHENHRNKLSYGERAWM